MEMLARIIGGAFGASLVVDGGRALWWIGLHQGLFFATASLVIAMSGVALIGSGALKRKSPAEAGLKSRSLEPRGDGAPLGPYSVGRPGAEQQAPIPRRRANRKGGRSRPEVWDEHGEPHALGPRLTQPGPRWF